MFDSTQNHTFLCEPAISRFNENYYENRWIPRILWIPPGYLGYLGYLKYLDTSDTLDTVEVSKEVSKGIQIGYLENTTNSF